MAHRTPKINDTVKFTDQQQAILNDAVEQLMEAGGLTALTQAHFNEAMKIVAQRFINAALQGELKHHLTQEDENLNEEESSAERVENKRNGYSKKTLHTPLVFIEQLVEGLRQTKISHIGFAEAIYDLLTQVLRDLPRARKVAAVEPAITIRCMPPVLQRPRGNADCLAGLPLRQSFRLTEFDQRNDFPAIMGTDQLSFIPQIASAFFDNISIVAASANALSFLAISRSFLAFSFLSSAIADI